MTVLLLGPSVIRTVSIREQPQDASSGVAPKENAPEFCPDVHLEYSTSESLNAQQYAVHGAAASQRLGGPDISQSGSSFVPRLCASNAAIEPFGNFRLANLFLKEGQLFFTFDAKHFSCPSKCNIDWRRRLKSLTAFLCKNEPGDLKAVAGLREPTGGIAKASSCCMPPRL
ncbi:hypothetical protein AXG93_531s1000 [Marchantia polymorpha subsp. ruderalis]|uniref:Uncharacterized protein n=1 Tax=Marchantia polymorpha subsp. ruderalis TaxID=1480154 RepID=A0A176VNY0_MARPO|nr:hypothetical protein AXG93_531s1000 [Marchantia polymorpha subsp. ruderalis]